MNEFLKETRRVLKRIDQDEIDRVLAVLRDVRERGGRLFLCGNGGGAGHASHATCDFRKVAGFEAYCVNDNVSELTARANDSDDGWSLRCYRDYLQASRYGSKDCLLVFSVGGGEWGGGVSQNLAAAVDYTRATWSRSVAIVGAGRGVVGWLSSSIVIPSDSTPIVEGIQAVIWHHLVTELAK